VKGGEVESDLGGLGFLCGLTPIPDFICSVLKELPVQE